MEDRDKFRLELLTSGNLETHYENGNFHNAKWPVGVKITLDGIVVKNKKAPVCKQTEIIVYHRLYLGEERAVSLTSRL